jgi:hypothetical protein
LEALDLNTNQLSGPIPVELGKLTSTAAFISGLQRIVRANSNYTWKSKVPRNYDIHM